MLSNICKSSTKPTNRGQSDKGRHAALTILLAAEKIFINEGYHNFSLRKVATVAGLTLLLPVKRHLDKGHDG